MTIMPLRILINKIFFYILRILSKFPKCIRLLYPYRDRLYRILFTANYSYFFEKFATGRYQGSHVALIQAPGWGVNTPPLSTASLTAFLRKFNYKVMPVDINVEMFRRNEDKYKEGWLVDVSNFWTNPMLVESFINDNRSILDRYVNCIIQSGARIIGFSIYNSSLSMSLYLAKEIKSKANDRIIVFGGPHASALIAGNSIIKNNHEVDFIVQGEGEETLLEIVQKKLAGIETDEYAGVLYREGDRPIAGAIRELIRNLDSLPFPDFSDFNLLLYREPFKIPISSSRGCINKCIFCNERPYWKIYRSRSGESMFEEVKYQIGRHPSVFFFEFHDSLCNGNIKALEKFANLIIDHRIKIQWAGQAIMRKEMTYELIVKIKRAGCINLAYGLETASSSTLEKIGKIFSKGVDVDKVISDSYRARLGCSLNFMFGLPGETEEEANENIEFIRSNAQRISAVNPSPAFCAISPGTIAFENSEKYGIDLSGGTDYWVSNDGTNNYLKRLERFERFVSTVHELGIPCVYSHSRLANRNEAIGNYYFAVGDFEKAIPYYEEAIKSESKNQICTEKLNVCYERFKRLSVQRS